MDGGPVGWQWGQSCLTSRVPGAGSCGWDRCSKVLGQTMGTCLALPHTWQSSFPLFLHLGFQISPDGTSYVWLGRPFV